MRIRQLSGEKSAFEQGHSYQHGTQGVGQLNCVKVGKAVAPVIQTLFHEMSQITFVRLGQALIDPLLGYGFFLYGVLPLLQRLLLLGGELFAGALVGGDRCSLLAEAEVVVRVCVLNHVVGSEHDSNEDSGNQQSLRLEVTKRKQEKKCAKAVAEENVAMPEEGSMEKPQAA